MLMGTLNLISFETVVWDPRCGSCTYNTGTAEKQSGEGFLKHTENKTIETRMCNEAKVSFGRLHPYCVPWRHCIFGSGHTVCRHARQCQWTWPETLWVQIWDYCSSHSALTETKTVIVFLLPLLCVNQISGSSDCMALLTMFGVFKIAVWVAD